MNNSATLTKGIDPFTGESKQDIIAIYLIINGSLNMSAGKIASQSFQAAQRLFNAVEHATPEQKEMLKKWREQGTRTITKFAATQELFDRCINELDGAVMIDEGLTEVEPNTATVLATYPIKRGELPRMLKHKRVRLGQ